MVDRAPLDRVLLTSAKAWSLRSTCMRRSVGCVLTDVSGHTLSSGHNGVPRGAQHCTAGTPCAGANCPSGTGVDLCEAVHAEINALLRCPDIDKIHTCYTTTSPCIHCVKALLNTSCRRIVFLDEYPHSEAKLRWERTGREWVQYKGEI